MSSSQDAHGFLEQLGIIVDDVAKMFVNNILGGYLNEITKKCSKLETKPVEKLSKRNSRHSSGRRPGSRSSSRGRIAVEKKISK